MNDKKLLATIVAVLFIVALVASEVTYYFRAAFPQSPSGSPTQRERSSNAVQTSSSAVIPRSVAPPASPSGDSATVLPISIRAISPSSVRAGRSITISGTGFSQLTHLTLGGDSHGDGIWLSNKDYSGELYGSDAKVNGDTAIMTTVPTGVCPGPETNACSSNFETPIPSGVYSVYIKANEGTIKSNSVSVRIIGTNP